MTIPPYTITEPVALYYQLHTNVLAGRLHVRFLDEQGEFRAYGFLDVDVD